MGKLLLIVGVWICFQSVVMSAKDYHVVVDLGRHIGMATHRASGFIYGLSEDGKQPPREFLTEIDVKFLRAGGAQLGNGGWVINEDEYKRRWQSVQAYYSVAKEIGATFILLVHDLWGADGVSDVPSYPGDNRDWTNFEVFLTRVINDALECGMTGQDVHWDIWNEPDIGTFWPRSQEQYLEMWQRAYKMIKAKLPDAIIVGPSIASPPVLNTAWFSSWLAYVKEYQVIPNYISWHELNTYSDPVASVQYLNNVLSELNIKVDGYQVNEYGPNGLQGPGASAWYIARLERAEVDGLRANWGMGEQLYDTMGALVVQVHGNYKPLPAWWVYKRYADMRGMFVNVHVKDSGELDGVASIDPAARQAIILLGSRGAAGGSSVTLSIRNVPAYLLEENRVRVVVERIPGSWVVEWPLSQPLTILSEQVTVNNGTLDIRLSWYSAQDAYVITLQTPN